MTADRSAATHEEFTARVAPFDAAPAAEESFRERLALALCIELETLGLSGEVSSRASDYLADAAIEAMRGKP